MSVLIGSARSDENGKYSGGKAGDQTGGEVGTQVYYLHTSGWWVVRPDTEEIAAAIALDMGYACKNSHIGYDQGQRGTLRTAASKVNYDCSKVTTDCETDCSELVGVCVNYAGVPVSTFTTVNLASTLEKTGKFKVLKDKKYCESSKYLLRGDILVTQTKGHTAVVLSNGSEATKDYAVTDDPSGGNEEDVEEILEVIGSLYDKPVTKADAILREVGYIDSKFNPSIQSSDITLSVINYTNLLGNLFSLYIPQNITSVDSEVETNVDNISSTSAKAIMKYLIDKGLNAAASCGIIANIYHESSFRTDAKGDYDKDGKPTSFGICQWHNERGKAMKKAAGSDWANDLTGQLDYLWSELTSSYKSSVLDELKKVKNTKQGAKDAADVFVRKFERPAQVDEQSKKRQATAESYWDDVVSQQV